MKEAFALQKLLTFFQQKYWHISDTNIRNFNETLTNDVVSFDQLGPGVFSELRQNSGDQDLDQHYLLLKHSYTMWCIYGTLR